MSFLVFNTQKPEKIAPAIEEVLRKEIGAPMPLTYQLVNAGVVAAGVTAGSALTDIGASLLDTKGTALFSLQFALPQPRPFQLQVTVNRSGIGAYVGQLSYAVRLIKPVSSEIALEPPQRFLFWDTPSKFLGNAEPVDRLNKDGKAIKRANELRLGRGVAGTINFTIDMCLKIVPQPTGSLLLLNTVPVKTKIGLGMILNVKKIFDFATMLDTLI